MLRTLLRSIFEVFIGKVSTEEKVALRASLERLSITAVAAGAEGADSGARPRRTPEGDDVERAPENCATNPPSGGASEVAGAVGALGAVPGAYPPSESGEDEMLGRVEIVI